MASKAKAPSDSSLPHPDALFGALFEHSPAGIAVFSVGGRFLGANPALCRMLGCSEAELLEKTHQDVIHVEDLEQAALARSQVISGKAKARLSERRYAHKDGSTVWAQVAGTVVRDPAGTPLCTLAIVTDVTGLKRAQRNAEQRFRRMVEMSSDWYWVQDTEFRFVEVPGLDIQDLDTDVVVGKARWEIPSLGALPDKVWEQHRARLKRHEPFSDFIFLRHNRQGELRYLSVSGEPLFDEQGAFRGYHGIGKDITDRARDQKALEDSENRYRRLFDANPQPMWVVDAKTMQFLAVNAAAIRLYGYSAEEFKAMTAEHIRPPEDVVQLRKAFQDARNYRERVWRHLKKDGELIQVRIASYNLDFEGRQARLGVIEDLTAAEERYRALLEERERG